MNRASPHSVRRKAVWGSRWITLGVFLLNTAFASNALAAPRGPQAREAKPGAPSARVKPYKLDRELTRRSRSANASHTTSVIVTLVDGATLPPQFRKFARGGELTIINGQVLELPNGVLKQLEAQPEFFRIHYNRDIYTHNYRTSVTVGARAAQAAYGYTGAGVGIAVIDSGITSWHDDLTNTTSALFPHGNQRVTKFVDFVNGQALPYDDNGHGSHVAGTILGNGYDSKGEKAGITPQASLVSLKVLDADGRGTIANIIAALNWIAANHTAYNIRVVNMSVGAGVYESYWTDPLTLAAKKITDLGITVVAAAGNLGKNAQGLTQYGAITAPANAPWVLAVCASSTMGTLTRTDDKMANYSSRGPTFIDFGAKPDVCAPGTGTVSFAVPGSTFYTTKSQYLLNGKISLGYKPYLTLSGTSMAAPVVTGTVAMMLQADPSLTPNLIKAILQYTAQKYPDYNALTQGAGFLNTLGAVRLARFYATAAPGARMPVQKVWSRQIIWGSHRLSGGYINPRGNAWATNVIWGAAKTQAVDGDNIVWGTICADATCDNIVWGTATDDDNIVWGTDCGGADCDDVIWGAASDVDNIVWGTALLDDNIVWGTTVGDDNIVWGTSADDDVTWGSASEDAVTYPDDASEPLPSLDLEFGDSVPLVEGGAVSTTELGTAEVTPEAVAVDVTVVGGI